MEDAGALARDFSLLALATGVALALRPWRLLQHGALLTPLLASLALLPWVWALPRLHAMPLQLQISGACLVLLMLGWPLAVPTLVVVALAAQAIAPTTWTEALAQALWHGVAPATFALALGWAIRRWIGTQIFVYVLGRGFLGTALCVFVGSLLEHALAGALPGVPTGLQWVARWLMAWGDAFLTGMLTAIFVAFRPQWLATWSDRLYLRPPA